MQRSLLTERVGMLVKPECIPCYLNQALNALNTGQVNEQTKFMVLNRLSGEISSLSPDRTPSYNSTLILKRANELMGITDPFVQAKSDSNQAVLKLVEKLMEVVRKEPDQLGTALKLAVAGNVIDLGIFQDYDIKGSLRAALQWEFDRDDYNEFKNRLAVSDSVMIIGDNAGEIVFDTILVKLIREMGKTVTYTVKKDPILNDATMIDAEETGMTSLVRVIDNGNGFLGTEWDFCSSQFKDAFHEASLVIAKGQANYESLEGTRWAGDKTYFLLKAKCPVVSEHLKVNYGDWVLRKNRVAE